MGTGEVSTAVSQCLRSRGAEGQQHLSAPVRLIPRPPTLVVSRNRKTLSSLLKSSTSRARTATFVEPSILWYLEQLRAISAGTSIPDSTEITFTAPCHGLTYRRLT